MSLDNKFKIISINENHFDDFYKKIDNYFESVIIYDKKTISNSLIHDFLYYKIQVQKCKEEDVLDNVKKNFNNHLSTYIKKLKINIINLGKRRKFDLLKFNDSLIVSIENIRNIERTFNVITKYRINYNNESLKFKWGKSTFVNDLIVNLCKKIISNPNINSLMSDCINCNDDLSNKNLLRFFKLMVSFDVYYEKNLEYFCSLISNVIDKNIPENKYYLIKKNNIFLSNIFILNDYYKYFTISREKFYFVNSKICIFEGLLIKIKNIYDKIYSHLLISKDINLILEFYSTYSNIIKLIVNNHSYYENSVYDLEGLVRIFDTNNCDDFLKMIKFIYLIKHKIFDKKIYNHDVDLNVIYHNIIEQINNLNKKSRIKIFINLINIINIFSYSDKHLHVIMFLVYKLKYLDRFLIIYQKELILNFNNCVGNKDLMLDFIGKNKKILLVMNMYIKPSYLIKLENVIDDLIYSLKNSKDLNSFFLITSFKNWDINLSEGHIKKNVIDYNLNENMDKFLDCNDFIGNVKSYESSVCDKNNTYISWFPHIGIIETTFISNITDFEIKMLPLHLMIIKYIDIQNNIDSVIEFFRNITTYSVDFLNSIIKSLIDSNLYKINGKLLISNEQYNNGDCNLIDIFNNISNIEIKWEKIREKELLFSRNKIISCAINSFIKNTKSEVTRTEIYNNVCNSISLFDVDSNMFDNVIDGMVKKEYIKEDKSFITKIYY